MRECTWHGVNEDYGFETFPIELVSKIEEVKPSVVYWNFSRQGFSFDGIVVRNAEHLLNNPSRTKPFIWSRKTGADRWTDR